MLYVPRHLPNKLEYKVLCCISVHYQSRMASNGIASTPSLTPTIHIIHARCYKASEWVGGEFTVQARYLGDFVDVACGKS